ncbi:hypothetical protein D3C72_2120150 [compost metagenome]
MAVVVGVFAMIITIGHAAQGQGRLSEMRSLFGRLYIAVRLVVRRCAAIAAKRHRTITLIRIDRATRRIHRQLLMVGPHTVAMSVRVGEDPTLQHSIR